MRVLFTTYPERTHFLLMVPLAWALRTAGHEVRFASQPKFADTITQAGLTAVPVGSNRDLWQILSRDPGWLGPMEQGGMPMPYDVTGREPEDISWEYLSEGFTRQVRRWHMASNLPMVADLVAFAQAWKPDLVIWDPLTYAGSVAAKACGAAHARLLFGTDMYGVTRDHFLRLASDQPEEDRIDPMREWLEGHAVKYGATFDETMITGQVTIDLVPESLQQRANRTYLPLRYVPYGGPATVPAWLRTKPAKPRVALTLGLSTTGHGGEYAAGVQDILDGLADLDIEVVATIAESEQTKLTRIPDNARVVSFAPLDALAATCDAVIHHAGYGTLATTALRGLPHLMLPWDNDGPALAEAVSVTGAGLVLNPKETTGEAVRDAVLRLLSEPGFRKGAEALRGTLLDMPTPNQLVPELEQFVASHQKTQTQTQKTGE
ncbi:glycosyl transferase [Streptomyces lunaelactis]|uniref:Glycosyl transferase n=1 Tax=Streptomyces lunaelactis TaxID=1535768 RepID=A0A2R4T1W6_9ACTN|nr:activator-dependent family glycosyltransferase [Streptomyces lunaelactis]AVZ73111.1 glycosyl transferase [Streptomyces lunaelactis]NUK06263.1 activator-dependent family glycosyltransferase [Streptomyces lunaelactis]NUK12964.1 activator-dependent family glycosyltransferase [Streptomyces lunaelactis]NUK20889.1 activator-dependent family glycosyltransferase [Streptomyces lunaelactis]NUK28333.1 activator-dependent family glycosyltransferase [Streptomyces lunaelactis]